MVEIRSIEGVNPVYKTQNHLKDFGQNGKPSVMMVEKTVEQLKSDELEQIIGPAVTVEITGKEKKIYK
jgi:hypothetical protein